MFLREELRKHTRCLVFLVLLARPAWAQSPLQLIDVPFIAQSEALCGGAAAAMVLRFWGERGLTAESFAHLVDRSAAGIRTTALVGDLRSRGWRVEGIAGTPALVDAELANGRPVLALVEDRPGTFHYVVIVGATPAAVVFHDPARSPYRAMPRAPFDTRWNAAGRWMAVITPGVAAAPPSAGAGRAAAPLSACDERIAAAVAQAQASRLDAAEAQLVAALSCPGAMRELAGVRLLQRRWLEVSELAAAATVEDTGDQYAWRLLGTSRFVQNDTLAALEAWNRAGEPKLDTMSVLGLERTRQRQVEGLVGAAPSALLTPALFTRSERRLAELPAASATRLTYVPVAGGLAELRATVVERPVVPVAWTSWAGIGARAAVRREIDVPIGPVTGGGERLTLGWRFWPGRPAGSVSLAAPAPSWMRVAGTLIVAGSFERQPFDRTFPVAENSSAGATLSTWTTARLLLAFSGGLERRRDRGAYAIGGARLRWLSLDDRVDVRGSVSGAAGRDGFSIWSAAVAARSAGDGARRVVVGRAGLAMVTSDTPADAWLAGDTGHARDVLLRAHPVLDDGRLLADRLGRRILHASVEGQQWWAAPWGVRVGAALFADTVRLSRRAGPGLRDDVDAGAGGRIAIPGLPGTFRVDLAKGLRDGATATSFAYDVGFQ